MRRHWAGMQASANLVMRDAAGALRGRDHGDALSADYYEALAAENAIYAEICARRTYGLPVTQQHLALRKANEAVRIARRAIH